MRVLHRHADGTHSQTANGTWFGAWHYLGPEQLLIVRRFAQMRGGGIAAKVRISPGRLSQACLLFVQTD